jgi:hypothetical protein
MREMEMRHVYFFMFMALLCLGAGTASAQPDESRDSNNYIYSDEINLGANEYNDTIDFGFIIHPPASSIGNLVWLDLNRNGIQDDFDASGRLLGIKDVRILLYYKLGDKDVIFGEQFTGEDGSYRFDGLPPGTYKVYVDRETLPDDSYQPTIPYAPGSTIENDSDGIGSTDTLPA